MNKKDQKRGIQNEKDSYHYCKLCFYTRCYVYRCFCYGNSVWNTYSGTTSYIMSPGDIYDFRAKVEGEGLKQDEVKVSDSRTGSIIDLKRVGNTDRYRITGLNEGVCYVTAEVRGVHASIRVEVKQGVEQHGESARSIAQVPLVGPEVPADTKEEKEAQARVIAKQIADSIDPSGTDLERVTQAASMVSMYCAQGTYTTSGEDYSEAYGVFVKGEFSCAGSTRALGMVLDYMGFEWEHVNENQWTHQWCRLEMDGQIGYADSTMWTKVPYVIWNINGQDEIVFEGQIAFVGYGSHPIYGV